MQSRKIRHKPCRSHQRGATVLQNLSLRAQANVY